MPNKDQQRTGMLLDFEWLYQNDACGFRYHSFQPAVGFHIEAILAANSSLDCFYKQWEGTSPTHRLPWFSRALLSQQGTRECSRWFHQLIIELIRDQNGSNHLYGLRNRKLPAFHDLGFAEYKQRHWKWRFV